MDTAIRKQVDEAAQVAKTDQGVPLDELYTHIYSQPTPGENIEDVTLQFMYPDKAMNSDFIATEGTIHELL